jgi:cytosine/adenosine deaminase-related metal-dependent hydrolase
MPASPKRDEDHPRDGDGTLVRNATIVTMNDRLEVLEGSVLVRDGRIVSVGPEPTARPDTIINAGGAYLLPGFIQTHIHLCQTLFRGLADDMPLLEWLKRRIWPLEAAHTPESLRASAALAACDLLLSGTTTALTMETVHDTDVVFETLADIGIRAVVGKCMMDSDRGVPPRLLERTSDSIDESLALKRRWDGAARGRLRAAFAPRFAVSCSRELLEAVAALSPREHALIHTHARSRATKSSPFARCRAVIRISSISLIQVSQRRSSAWRTACGSRKANRRCSPSATSRSCIARDRT